MTPAARRLRAEGVSVGRLAEESGLAYPTVSGYLGGHFRPSPTFSSAVRRLLPKAVADEVLSLCDEARSDG